MTSTVWRNICVSVAAVDVLPPPPTCLHPPALVPPGRTLVPESDVSGPGRPPQAPRANFGVRTSPCSRGPALTFPGAFRTRLPGRGGPGSARLGSSWPEGRDTAVAIYRPAPTSRVRGHPWGSPVGNLAEGVRRRKRHQERGRREGDRKGTLRGQEGPLGWHEKASRCVACG